MLAAAALAETEAATAVVDAAAAAADDVLLRRLAVASARNYCVILQWQGRPSQCPFNLGVAAQWFITSEHRALQMVRLERPSVLDWSALHTHTTSRGWQGTKHAGLGLQAQASEDKHKRRSGAISRCPFGVRNNTHTQTVLSDCVSVGFYRHHSLANSELKRT